MEAVRMVERQGRRLRRRRIDVRRFCPDLIEAHFWWGRSRLRVTPGWRHLKSESTGRRWTSDAYAISSGRHRSGETPNRRNSQAPSALLVQSRGHSRQMSPLPALMMIKHPAALRLPGKQGAHPGPARGLSECLTYKSANLGRVWNEWGWVCLLYTSPSPRDQRGSRMPSSA